jgi:hypothetical protein
MRNRPLTVISSLILRWVVDQWVSYHCTVAILRKGGSARSPCAAAVPQISVAVMLRLKMNERTAVLTGTVFGVNAVICIDLPPFDENLPDKFVIPV